MESNYGYIIGENPSHNIWTSIRQLTLLDNTVVLGYEGTQTESDDNVVIIGTLKAFNEWQQLNTIQQTPENE